MTRALLVSVLCLSLAGCGTVEKVKKSFSGGEDNQAKPTPLEKFIPSLKLVKLWSRDIGDGSDDKYLKLIPSVRGSNTYIAENGGDVFALDNSAGKTVWDIDTDRAITGGPGLSDNSLMVGTEDGELVAVDPLTGQKKWIAELTSEILAAPTAAEGIVVARTIDGKLFGLAEDTGKRLWVYDRSVPALTLRGTSNPVIDTGLVFTGFDGGKLAAIELTTGKLVWETRIAQSRGSNELDRMIDIDSDPVVDGGTVFVTTFQGNVAAVDTLTGRILWLREIPSYAGIAVNDDFVFVSDDESLVWALDRYTGDSIWRQEKLKSRAATAPALLGDFVVVGDKEGYLHWMNVNNGEFLARSRLNKSQIIAPPIVADNKLFAYAVDGTMAVFTYKGAVLTDSETGEVLDEEDYADKVIDPTEDEQPYQTEIEDNYDEDSDEGTTIQKILDIFSIGDDDEEN